MKKLIILIANLNILIGTVLVIAPVIFLIFLASGLLEEPKIFATDAVRENQILTGTTLENPNKSILTQAGAEIKSEYVVPQSGVITSDIQLIIPAIGVDTVVYESYDGVAALEKGVWRMPQYGLPGSQVSPLILSAHRWGYDYMSWEHRSKNLFLNLPNLKENDLIYVVMAAKTYTYRVVLLEDNEFVSTTSDLILITCRYFDSPVRVFAYAELLL